MGQALGDCLLLLHNRIEGSQLRSCNQFWYYSFDNSFPDRFYPKYTEPLIPPKDATTLKVITYKGKQAVGRMTVMPLKEMQKRAEGKNEDEE